MGEQIDYLAIGYDPDEGEYDADFWTAVYSQPWQEGGKIGECFVCSEETDGYVESYDVAFSICEDCYVESRPEPEAEPDYSEDPF